MNMVLVAGGVDIAVAAEMKYTSRLGVGNGAWCEGNWLTYTAVLGV